MKLTFQIRFHTKPGESLWLTGDHPLFGNGREDALIAMQYCNAETWSVALDVPEPANVNADIRYHYVFRRADGSLVQDWGRDRGINPALFDKDEVFIIDSWNDPGSYENAFSAEPFREVLLKANHGEVEMTSAERVTHVFNAKAPLLKKGQTLCLLGNIPTLGNWNTSAPVLLGRADGKEHLSGALDLTEAAFPIAYKYGVFDVEQKRFLRYEDGENRTLAIAAAPDRFIQINDGFARLPNDTWRGAGVAIPVFSLRSECSFGVGEFADLKPLVDWAERTGLKLIQILPINDTRATHTWTDSYPYAAISAFALHPQYLRLNELATGQDEAYLKSLEPERARLNDLAEMDYEAVMATKLEFIGRAYKTLKEKTFKSKDYQEFFVSNRDWLEPYAVFCYLRDQFGTADFSTWPKYSRYNAKELAGLTREDSETFDDIAINYFIQYHLHVQLKDVADYAHANGVILKGDIAIGVSRYGADAWQEPELFHMDVQAGAPPDPFAMKGQNWGFPTYNWPRMKEDGFLWWRRRFKQMGHYFDAFRVDHILGFFRIWSIPLNAVEGILGRFVPIIPVDVEEFGKRGIVFDRERFVEPFITEAILQETFGDDCKVVKRTFLTSKRKGRYALKSDFDTQQKVEAHFAKQSHSERNVRIKQGLFDLISNVILLEDEAKPGRAFHFRFSVEDCTSFKDLDAATQARLRELYIDYFYRRQDGFWMKEAMQKLPALKESTDMLVCGEDLGVVPACVPEAMRQMGLLSLEVQRMPKVMGLEFSRPENAPYLSVVTPSTHDMSTIRGWWREERSVTQRFFNVEVGGVGEAPRECSGALNQEILRQHLASPAMWGVFQLQDLLGMDERLRRADPDKERINVPANPKNYWRYRMHLMLEDLCKAEEFNANLGELIREQGR